MYQAAPLREPVTESVIPLSQSAWEGSLAICVGAGISVASPANLPTGTELAETLFDRLAAMLGDVPDALRSDLVAFADYIEERTGSVEMLQRESLAAFDLVAADPNFAHRVLALLASEGAIVLFVTNWDDCIERGVLDATRMQAIITTEDRMSIEGALVLKVHGCATRRNSLIISSSQLDHPPLWVELDIGNALNTRTFVFAGIGDVADHTRRRIEQLLEAVDTADRIRVVSPTIADGWEDTAWSRLVPDLPSHNKIQLPANSFLDDLLRGYVLRLFTEVRTAASHSESLAGAFDALKAALSEADCLRVAMWIRRGAVRWRQGTPAMASVEARFTMLAAGKLTADAQSLGLGADAYLTADGDIYELLYSDRQIPASRLMNEGLVRLEHAKAWGRVPSGATVTFVCDGHLGALHVSEALAEDVVGEADPSDIIDGPTTGRPRFVSSRSFLEDR